MKTLETISQFYSSDKIVKFYSEERLFPDEKIVFERYLIKKGAILDICCGAGRASFPLAEMGHEVTGVDINERLIKTAKEKGRNNYKTFFILSDIEYIKPPENSFDYILILHNSLETIPNREKRDRIFKKLFYALKPGGLLISTFHSAYYPFHIVKKLITGNLNIRRQPGMEHNDLVYEKSGLFYHIFTPREIYSSFGRAGFKLHAVHSNLELLSGNSFFKKYFFKLLIPFDYAFWVFKKTGNRD